MRSRALVSLLLGVLVSTACLWYALKDVNLPAMVRGKASVDLTWVIASVVAGLLSLVVRAIRWQVSYLLRGYPDQFHYMINLDLVTGTEEPIAASTRSDSWNCRYCPNQCCSAKR